MASTNSVTGNQIVENGDWTVNSITTQTTALVKAGPGVLGNIIIPTPVANATVKIYDSLSAAGAVLLDTITFPASPQVTPIALDLNFRFGIGLTVVTGGATMSLSVGYL